MCRKIVVLLFACAFVLGAAGLSMADPPGAVFELDGNSVLDGFADDWNLLNGDGTCSGTGCQPGAPGSSLARSFISEPAGVNVFQGGGSKDPLDIPNWKWKQGSTPDKDTITNGYAAAYQDGSNHLILVFGADRFAVNGDANIGIWFFQADVHPVGTTGGTFSGVHQPNDVFIVSAFTQGGGVSTITVYLWDPTCPKGVHNPGVGDCAETNLRLAFASAETSTCDTANTGCAVVNSGQITVTWPYLAKFGNITYQVPTGGFYEGGIDLTDLLGAGNLPCFTSWLIETRSSQSPSAVLKDFVSGSFPLCGLKITKECSGPGIVNPGGTSINYLFDGTVKNTGVGTLYNVTLVDNLPAGATNVEYTCSGAPCSGVFASVGPGVTVDWTVSFDSTATTVDNSATVKGAVTNTTPGTCTDAGTVCASSDIANCITIPNNDIQITKFCGVPAGYPNAVLPGTQLVTQNGLAAVRVNFSGQVCNMGQTPLTGVTLTDNPGAVITPSTIPTLAAMGQPGDCVNYSGYYLPDGVTPGTELGGVLGRWSFSDEIKVTGATATLGDSPGPDETCLSPFTSGAQACSGATCNVCPAGTCGGN